MPAQLALPPHVVPEMLTPDYWLARLPAPDAPLIAPDAVAAFNARTYDAVGVPPVLDLPDALPADQVRAAARAYLPRRTYYTAEGHPLEPAAFERVLAAALPDLPDPVPVAFGVAVQRTDLRAFPTAGVITARPFEYAFDRIQESTIDVGWPVAILATSADQAWHFCLTPHYWGWVRAAHLAHAPRHDVAEWVGMEPFAVTIANRGLIALGAHGGLTPQMGTRLPLHEHSAGHWLVAVPERGPDGGLRLTSGLIPAPPGEEADPYAADFAPEGTDFVPGYLPPTPRSIITQAFKPLGEPYAWGGSRLGIFGRDCSRLVRDVFATTGILLPRNGDQQADACYTRIAFGAEMDAAARQRAIATALEPGAILELPGHVMIYLGTVDDRPYALHDTANVAHHGVIVSDLSLGAGSADGSLLDRLTRAVMVADQS